MVYIMWLYFFGQVVANVFIGIYIYQISQSFFDIAIYNILLFSWAFITFVWLWLLAWIYKWNIKNFYFWAYVLFIVWFLILLLNGDTEKWVFLFGFVYGWWIWLYYNAVHTQELNNISKSSRNHYSSSVNIGKNLIESLLPLLLAILFYIWNDYSIDIYPLLFWTLILIYVIWLFKIKWIQNYYPSKIIKWDIINFCNLSKYKFWHLYYLNTWFTQLLYIVITSITTIYFLNNEINIWVFQWLLSVIWTILIIYISFKRNNWNEFYYYKIFSILILLNTLFLSIYFNLFSYILFLLIILILTPLYRVSKHIYDLATMDNVKTEISDFYPAMLLREILLLIWRLLAFIVLFILFYHFDYNIEYLIRITLVLIWISYITQVVLIKYWENNEKIDNN